MKRMDSLVFRWVLGGSIVFVPGTLLAQGEPPPPPAPPPEAAPAEAPPPAQPVEETPPPPVEAAPEEPGTGMMEAEGSMDATMAAPMDPPADTMEAAEEEAAADEGFSVTTGVGFRAALRMQDPTDPESLGDIGFDELNVEPRFSGKVTDIVGWTANLTVSGITLHSELPGPLAFEARALDLVGQLDFDDWFHVWMGRLLTPSDRSNFSGPWFMSPWTYTGGFFAGDAAYVGPRGTEEFGREVGVVAWGHDPDGKFKYYAGVMDLDSNAGNTSTAAVSPLYAARIGYAAIGSEPGFYGSSTYYGSQDILALGVAARSQAALGEDDPATAGADESDDTDLFEVNADLLAEFNPTGVGTLTGELAYYHFDGDVQPMDGMFVGLLSYTTENMIGIGKLQPLVRFQTAFNNDTDQAVTQIDGGINYVMKDYFAKLALMFTTTSASVLNDPLDPDDGTSDVNAKLVQLGFQIQQ